MQVQDDVSTKLEAPKWRNKRVRLGDIKPYEHNPRFITTKRYGQLTESMQEDGYSEPILIDTDGTIISGHQRVKVMYNEYKWNDDKIVDVRIPNRKLTEKEFKRQLLRANRQYGETDYDMLSSHFTDEEIDDGHYTKEELGMMEDMEEVEEKVRAELEEEQKNVTFRISVPEEDSVSFENQLDELLAKFPRAEKK